MTEGISVPPRQQCDSAEEITRLIETLLNAGQRLEELTAGEVDTVTDREGRTFVLGRAQAELRNVDAIKQAAILNALPAHIALLDAEGAIVSVNETWRRFGDANQLLSQSYGVGLNYLAICDQSCGVASSEARPVGSGIRSVLSGREKSFTLEYPCHSPNQQRWYLLTVTPLNEGRANGAVVMHVDITGRKLAEKSTLEFAVKTDRRERMFHTMLSSISDFTYLFDRKGRLLFANQPLLALWGISLEDAVGKHFFELGYSEEIARELQARIQNVFVTHTSQTGETPYTSPAGVSGSYEYIFSPAFTSDGSVEFVVGCTRDISDRKRIEAALRTSNSKLEEAVYANQQVLDFSLDVVCRIDANGKFLSLSAACERLFGYVPEEMIGRPFLDFMEPDDREASAATAALLPTGLKLHDYENRYVRKDGKRVTISWSATWSEVDQSIFCVGRDCTERKRAEQALKVSESRYHSLFENMLEGYAYCQTHFEHDHLIDFTYLEVNSAFGKLTGLTDVVGRKVSEVLPGIQDTNRDLLNVYGRVALTGKPEKVETYIDILKIWLSITVYSHEKAHFVAVFDNITQRKLADEALRESAENMAFAQRIAHLGSWQIDIVDPDDVDSSPLRWSDEMFRIAGFAPGAIPVDNALFFRLVPEDEHALIRDAVAHAIRERREYSIVHRLIRPDGETRVVQETGQIFFDDKTGQVSKIAGTAHDITERKHADDTLRAVEREQRQLLEQLESERARLLAAQRVAKIGSWETDLATLDVVWSKETHHIHETDSTTYRPTHKKFLAIVHPEDRVAVDHAFRHSFNQHGDCSIEHRLVMPGGRIKFVEKHWRIVFDAQNVPLRAAGTCQDITERKRMEARFRRLVDSNVQGVIFFNMQGDILEANDAYLELVGYSREDLSAGRLNWVAQTPPEYADLDRRSFAQLAATGSCAPFEKEYIRKDGSRVPILLGAATFEDNPNEGVCFFLDLSARKQSEALLQESQKRLALATESAHIGIWDLDIVANKLVWNPEMYKLYGVDEKDFSGAYEAWQNGLHPDDRARAEADFTAALTGLRDFRSEFRVVWRNGDVRHIEAHGISQRPNNGPATRMIGVNWDITDRKRAQAELEKTTLNLLEASRLAGKAEVATEVLHNVGNVLNSVNVASSCITESLRKSKLSDLEKIAALLSQHEADLGDFMTKDPKGKHVAAYIALLATHLQEEQTAVLTELAGLQRDIEHIKVIVKMQQGVAKGKGVVESLKAADLVEDALKINAAAVARHGIEVVRKFDDGPPILVEKHKLLQILINLVRNAKDACAGPRPIKGRLTVSVTHEPDIVRIVVSDNGVGIPPENLTRIFAHGFTTKKDGHGFGLHSGILAAQEMGARLTVSSAGIGAGATFTLEVPYKPIEAPQ